MLDQGLITRLVQLLNSDDLGLRLNSLWAFKNLLHKSSADLKNTVMESIGWRNLSKCGLSMHLTIQLLNNT